MQANRRHYEKKLRAALKKREHRKFIVEQLGREWDEIQRVAKKEELVRRAKAAGVVAAKSILALLLIGGAVTVMAVAPNIFAAVGRISGRKGFFDKRELRRAAAYLKSKKYATIREKGEDGYVLQLTEDGAEVIMSKALKDLRIRVRSPWDGIWRIVMFDIPNRHKWARDTLRQRLKLMGFYQMQESVFVSPYPCHEEIKFLISLLNVNDYIRLVETSAISHDEDLREFFSL